jgi:PAS domain S-box-containing protein
MTYSVTDQSPHSSLVRSKISFSLGTSALVIMAAVLFAWDIALPTNYGPWLLYSPLLLATLWLPYRWDALLLAGACTILIVVGFHLSPPGPDPWADIFNRSLGVLILWITAVGCLFRKRATEKDGWSSTLDLSGIGSLDRKLLVGSALVASVLTINALVSIEGVRETTTLRESTGQARELLFASETVLATVQDADIRQRGYILTGRDVYLDSYRKAIANLDAHAARLRSLVPADLSQRGQIDNLQALITKQVEELQRTIDRRSQQGLDATLDTVLSDQGRQLTDDIRAAIAILQRDARVVISHGEEQAEATLRRNLITFSLATVLALVLLGLVYMVIQTDLTKRRNTEGVLRASEEKYRALVETTNTGYLIMDPAGTVLDANQEYIRLTGRQTSEQIIGRNVAEWTAPYDIERNIREIKRCTEQGFLRNLEIDYIDANGHVIPIEISATVLHTPEGTRILRLCRDISARKRAEEELAELARRNASLVQALGEIVYDHSITQDRIEWSGNTKAVLGYGPDELGTTQKGWFDRMHPDDVARVRAEFHQTGWAPVFATEYRYRHRDGHYVWIHDRGVVHRDGAGHPSRIVGIMGDISERKRAEEEIRLLNTELEQRVVERTSQLETAYKELEAFSYSVSHDLRAPLRTIDGFSLALAEDYAEKLDDTGRDFVARVRAAAQRMGQLIDDLLQLAYVTRTELQKGPVDLTAIAETIVTDLRRLEPSRQVTAMIQHGLVTQGDARLIRVALENLIGNAWKFTGTQATALVEFCRVEHNGASVYCIKDNGVGFDMTYVNKLFGPFQRLHAANEFPGTGVGLATVQRIIRRHGGQIWAEAEVNKGASVYFTL